MSTDPSEVPFAPAVWKSIMAPMRFKAVPGVFPDILLLDSVIHKPVFGGAQDCLSSFDPVLEGWRFDTSFEEGGRMRKLR
jgi:hypothetical protein